MSGSSNNGVSAAVTEVLDKFRQACPFELVDFVPSKVSNENKEIVQNLFTEYGQQIAEELQNLSLDCQIDLLHMCVVGGVLNDDTFNKIQQLGAYDLLMQLVDCDDPLLQMMSADLLGALCLSPLGVEYLLQNGKHALAERLDNEDDLLSLSTLLRLLGNVCQHGPKFVNDVFTLGDNSVVAVVKKIVDDGDVSALLAVCDFWKGVGSSLQGREVLMRLMPESLDMMIGLTRHASSSELVCAALDAWTEVVSDGDVFEQKGWKDFMGDTFFNALIGIFISRPFADQRKFIYRLMAATATHSKSFALRLLQNHTAANALLDSSSDQSSETKYAKFELITVLIKQHDEWLSSELGAERATQIRAYYKGGPFYLPVMPKPEVATKYKGDE